MVNNNHMKRIVYFVSVLLVAACADDGLNKQITEELTPEEIRVNLKDNPSFEYLYGNYTELREWIMADNLRLAKYGSITYKQLIDYSSCGISLNEAESEHIKMYPNRQELRKQADSLIDYYRSVQPDSLLTITFKKKSVRKTILGTIPEFYLTITPLKGTVEQFRFDYYFSPKIQGETKIDDIPFSLQRHGNETSPLNKEKTLLCLGELWTDTLEDVSNEELHRDYNFIYQITNVRYKGQNWDELPYTLLRCIDANHEIDERTEDDIIKEMIYPDYITPSDLLIQRYHEIAQKEYPDIYAMYEEYNAFDYK